jgi:hypothetical protein
MTVKPNARADACTHTLGILGGELALIQNGLDQSLLFILFAPVGLQSLPTSVQTSHRFSVRL